MSLAIVYSRAQRGIDAPLVTVEIHISNGLPSLSIVGLPETAVKESKDRVRSAIINSHFDFPARRITINLAPADLPKEGGRFDLPIALGILAASEQIPASALENCEFLGELALSGELRPVKGVLPAALKATEQQRKIIVPKANADEAALSKQAEVLAADHLLSLCAHLHGRQIITNHQGHTRPSTVYCTDIADVKGQSQAKRALEIAAAGGHNLLMIGSPGTGKTMLASRLPGILPALTEDEALAYATIQSVTQGRINDDFYSRPFRAPHHTASAVALVGGGNPPKPGEISLAHNGVLFLDELPEFPRAALEVLREPLESGEIIISRASHQACFPAAFQLIAAMNPCPCGYYGDSKHNCRCTPDQISRYRNKISGPLLDRIDMHIQVNALPIAALIRQNSSDNKDRNKEGKSQQNSQEIRARVTATRELQLARQGVANHRLNNKMLEKYCPLLNQEQQILEDAINKLGLSARAYHRILRVSRTIADLEQSVEISSRHIHEALSYRNFDRSVKNY